jgi:hypothetical protein
MKKWPRPGAAILAIALALGQSARAEPQAAPPEPLDQTMCAIIEAAAGANHLPKSFLTRLIWRESALRASSISPAGAQGVAQFMPGTAAERGLADPFDPETAIPEAARFLAELAARFGNLGLAAAAYNAGPARVANWLSGRGEMPAETRAYVLAITARDLDEWARPPPPDPGSQPKVDKTDKAEQTDKTDNQSCLPVITAMRGAVPAETIGQTLFAPWGVQLAGNFSKALALASFERVREKYQPILGDAAPFVLASRLRNRGASPFFRVRLPASTRAEAQRLCERLHSAGASCVVLRS